MTVIYEFPPVAVRGRMWTVHAPVMRSRDAITAARYVASSGPALRRAHTEIKSRTCLLDGSGLAESLIRLLDGGVNMVRIHSPRPLRRGRRLATGLVEYREDDDVVVWRDGDDEVSHFSASPALGVAHTVTGYHAIRLTGLPPNELAVQANDVLRSYAPDGTSRGTARAIAPAWADAAGEAVVLLFEALAAGIISVDDRESAVFEIDGEFPEVIQPWSGEELYPFTWIEVLPEHIPAGATERNPWPSSV